MTGCVSTHFMTHVPVLIDKTVVCRSLGQIVSCSDCTTIWIGVGPIKNFAVIILLSNSCESIIKSQINNLWSMFSGVGGLGSTAVTISTIVSYTVCWVAFLCCITFKFLSPNGHKNCKYCSYKQQSHLRGLSLVEVNQAIL